MLSDPARFLPRYADTAMVSCQERYSVEMPRGRGPAPEIGENGFKL